MAFDGNAFKLFYENGKPILQQGYAGVPLPVLYLEVEERRPHALQVLTNVCDVKAAVGVLATMDPKAKVVNVINGHFFASPSGNRLLRITFILENA